MRINIRLISIYLFSLVILYLAGVYLGSILYVIFIFYALLPVFSVTFLVYSYLSVDFQQIFSTVHPVKGEKVEYTLVLKNTALIPLVNLDVLFENVSPFGENIFEDFTTYIPANSVKERNNDIVCPYRGEYSLGVKELIIHDFLNFFALRKRINPVKFSVYPRILQIDGFAPVATEIEGTGKHVSKGVMPDLTLFQELREYRDGDSIRHIYWKKYASTGRPYLKEYEKTKKTGVRIYFDARKREWRGVNALEQEDVSVEILVALVKFFLDRSIHTTIMATGANPYVFKGADYRDFQDFYKSTPKIHFTEGLSPIGILQADNNTGLLESQTAVIISHVPDADIFSTGSTIREGHVILVMNASCFIERDTKEIKHKVALARGHGNEIITVTGSDELIRELGANQYVEST